MIRRLAIPMVAMLAMGVAGAAQAQFNTPSKQQQVQLGRQAADENRAKEKGLPAFDEKVKLLRNVAKRIMSTFDDSKEPWQYSFDVLQNKELNAFALPGGPVFFYTGLLDKLKTEDQVADVFDHKMTQV